MRLLDRVERALLDGISPGRGQLEGDGVVVGGCGGSSRRDRVSMDGLTWWFLSQLGGKTREVPTSNGEMRGYIRHISTRNRKHKNPKVV